MNFISATPTCHFVLMFMSISLFHLFDIIAYVSSQARENAKMGPILESAVKKNCLLTAHIIMSIVYCFVAKQRLRCNTHVCACAEHILASSLLLSTPFFFLLSIWIQWNSNKTRKKKKNKIFEFLSLANKLSRYFRTMRGYFHHRVLESVFIGYISHAYYGNRTVKIWLLLWSIFWFPFTAKHKHFSSSF